MNSTIDYYNNHAESFSNDTLSCDFRHMQDQFLEKLSPHAHILDLGCGSGRDSRYFIEKNYKVTAIDGSIELCKLATKNIGQNVLCKTFDEINDINTYQGIWACASLLHLKKDELLPMLKKCAMALKPNGVLYTSFKYGDFEGVRNGRYFTDLNEHSFNEIIKQIPELSIIKTTITSDIRVGRENEKWLNSFCKKI